MTPVHDEIEVKILIVDDKVENIYSLETLLKQEISSLTFLRATSGNEALKMAYKEDIALILLDVQMPEMDGYEVATILKQVKTCQNIPIIFVTALSQEARYVTEGYSKGAVDYLFKPLDPTITRSKVNSFVQLYLQQKRLEAAYHNLELIVQQRTSDLETKNAELNKEIERRLVAEEELQQYNARLVKLNKDLDQFVYTASHDLKLPVANLQGLIQVLREETEDKLDEQTSGVMDMLDQSVSQLKNTIQDLIDIIKKEQDGIHVETLSCGLVLEEVKTSIAELIRESGATLTDNFGEHCQLVFNKVAFKSILYNLITNSIKYRHPDRLPAIDLQFWQNNDQIRLSIKDNSKGMSEEELQKVFHLFERLNEEDEEGTGMGLYIVKKMLDKYGASVKVKSVKEVGTEFVFLFQSI